MPYFGQLILHNGFSIWDSLAILLETHTLWIAARSPSQDVRRVYQPTEFDDFSATCYLHKEHTVHDTIRNILPRHLTFERIGVSMV